VPFLALLDACVLHPMVLCDTLLRVSMSGLYLARWTPKITEEVSRSILRRRPDLDPDRMQRRIDAMNLAIPDAEINDSQTLTDALASVGMDAHVVSAAITGRVHVIVTANVRDFTHPILAQHGIEVKTPDDFLVDMYWLDPAGVIAILRQQAAATSKPPLAVSDVLHRLGAHAPAFVELVNSHVTADSGE